MTSVFVVVALALPATASATNALTVYGKLESVCSCNLRGTRAQIDLQNSWTIVSNQSGNIHVAAASMATQAHAPILTTGAMKETGFAGDCDTSSTGGDIRNYDEVADQATLTGTCRVYSNSVGGTLQTYRSQRWNTLECGVTDCAANWIDDTLKQHTQFLSDVLFDVEIGGELLRTSGTWEDANTFVKGSVPGSGTKNWARTSDIHVNGGGGTSWTTITSAQCAYGQLPQSAHWHLGVLTGSFNIYFEHSGADGQCPGP